MNAERLWDDHILIVDYAPEFAPAFRDLNARWIEEFFTMEESDRVMLEDPQRVIIDAGGRILVATMGDQAVGVCALVPEDEATYQLAKMAVSPTVQGLGIGRMLGEAAIEAARSMGARQVILFTNDVLEPAMNLYRSLGFERIPLEGSKHARSNTKMVFRLA
jgi:GNAT superfamily N-acetyltransferase